MSEGWINIADNVPKVERFGKSRKVIISDGKEYTMAFYNGRGSWILEDDEWFFDDTFPYWHDIPRLGA